MANNQNGYVVGTLTTGSSCLGFNPRWIVRFVVFSKAGSAELGQDYVVSSEEQAVARVERTVYT